MMRHAEAVGWALVAFCFLQIPSLRAITAFTGAPVVVPLAFFIAYVVAFRLIETRSPILAPLDARITPALMLVVLWGAIIVVYPQVKAQADSPTSDTALIAPIEALKLGRAMYDLDGLLGPSASPGPGWVLVNAPLTVLGSSLLYTLMSPAWLGASWAVLRWSGASRRLATAWLLLLFSGLISWTMTLAGYDILILGVVTTMLYVATERLSFGPTTRASLLLAVLVGVFATSRIIFMVLPVLLALVISRHDRVHAALFAAVSLAVAVALHTIFAIQPGGYDPLHLLARAQVDMPLVFLQVGALLCVALFAIAIFRMRADRTSQLAWFSVLLAAPLVIEAVGELVGLRGDLERWEGGNYFVPAAGPLLLLALRSLTRRQQAAS